MTDAPTDDVASPLEWTRNTLRSAWNDLLSVYYANTLIWRLLKSAALLFFGLFCWSGANLLLSYQPEWRFLYYVLAYGFLLLVWGPFTHLVVVPTVIRLRRSGAGGLRGRLARHGSKLNLTVFLLLVLVLGAAPLGVMTFEFQVPAGVGGDGASTSLECTRSGDVVHCHLTDARGIDHVVMTSGGEELTRLSDPPFEFDVAVGDLASTGGDRQFTVELRDGDGSTIRRFIRRADLIPG